MSVLLVSCDKQEIVGEVNGHAITQVEFKRYLAFKNIPESDEKRRAAILKDYMQREGFASVIEGSKDFDADLIKTEVNEFRKQLVINRYFEKFLNGKVNDEAIQNYYNTRAEDFQSEKIKVAHILIRTHDKMSSAEQQAALTRAQEAYSKARAGKDFADVAMQYSEDTISSKQGGELGWLSKGAIDPVFSATIFAAKVAEITEPFKSAFGFHVVKVLEGSQLIKMPFEKVKGDIRYRLRQQAKQAEMDRLVAAVEISYQ